MNSTEDQKLLKELELQLSCPHGDMGIEVANNMNASNITMTIDAILMLKINSGDRVLEIGHGNCGHLKTVLSQADNITYFGLEISNLMREEALRINQDIMTGNCCFDTYDGDKIPYPDQHFDRIFTVNTIYFWKQPLTFLEEIHRVLKPGGICVTAFALKEFMEALPFVREAFTLYNITDMQELVHSSPLDWISHEEKYDRAKSKSGALVDRKYAVVVLRKGQTPS